MIREILKNQKHMNTIKERAEEKSKEKDFNGKLKYNPESFKMGYIKGCVEQRDIDIENAYSWFKNNGFINEEVKHFFEKAMKSRRPERIIYTEGVKVVVDEV